MVVTSKKMENTASQNTPYDDSAVISADDSQGFSKKKKRPGLAEGLVPGKKAMKFHNSVYNNSKS